jgi:hypothetical protein
MSEAVTDKPARIPMKEYIERKLAEQEAAKEAEEKHRRQGMPSAEVIPFPATAQRRYQELVGKHLYRRSEGVREWKRHLKQVGVAPERIDAELHAMAVALGFRKYKG